MRPLILIGLNMAVSHDDDIDEDTAVSKLGYITATDYRAQGLLFQCTIADKSC